MGSEMCIRDREQQRADEEFGPIIALLEKDVKDKTSQDYVLDEGILFHISNVTKFHAEPSMQLCIPTNLRSIVLPAYHDEEDT